MERELSTLKERVAVLGRRELKETSGAFLDGLLSGIERKTGWLMAEQAGAERPYRMQSLLGRSRWDAELLRDAVRAYAVEALADPDGVLIVDETGFLKKGEHSAGVARQYSGTAGGSKLPGRRVPLLREPLGSCADRSAALSASGLGRRWRAPAKATIPATTMFATKPAIARDLIASALDAGVPCAFVLGDALYGSDRRLRRMLEARQQPYVLAVRSNEPMRVGGGSLQATTSGLLTHALPPDAWACHAAGEGAKGPRLYDWARLRLFWSDPQWEHWLLVRRSRKKRKSGPTTSSSPPLAQRSPNWPASPAALDDRDLLATAKDELGLDHWEARSWPAWHRHITLVMAAAAFLAKLRADLVRASMTGPPESKRNERSPGRADAKSQIARRNSASPFQPSAICSPALSS